MVTTHIELSKIAIRQDQPLKTLEILNSGLKIHKFETHLLCAVGRVHDMLNDTIKAQ